MLLGVSGVGLTLLPRMTLRLAGSALTRIGLPARIGLLARIGLPARIGLLARISLLVRATDGGLVSLCGIGIRDGGEIATRTPSRVLSTGALPGVVRIPLLLWLPLI